MSLKNASQITSEIKAIIKDLLSGELPWTELLNLILWQLFHAYLDDEIILTLEK
jgi:hypothetical protein